MCAGIYANIRAEKLDDLYSLTLEPVANWRTFGLYIGSRQNLINPAGSYQEPGSQSFRQFSISVRNATEHSLRYPARKY